MLPYYGHLNCTMSIFNIFLKVLSLLLQTIIVGRETYIVEGNKRQNFSRD